LAARKTLPRTEPATERVPENLDGHVFYGLAKTMNDEQCRFRDAIWNAVTGDGPKLVFVNSRAGTGKTTIAVATSMLLVEYGLLDRIIYLSAAGTFEGKQGYLPGDLAMKSQYYAMPCIQALLRIGRDPMRVVDYGGMMDSGATDATVYCMTDTFLRGVNLNGPERGERTALIVDEAENYTAERLKTVLTRFNDDGGVCIVIGHDDQCDLPGYEESGFALYRKHFEESGLAVYCELTHNYRGKIASFADELVTRRKHDRYRTEKGA
jgi:PhoH-like ATPase